MIVDIIKIAEDENTVCYKTERMGYKPGIILVNKQSLTVTLAVTTDTESDAGSVRKIKKAVQKKEFPEKLLLATG